MLSSPDTEPILLKTLPSFDSPDKARTLTQKGMRDSATPGNEKEKRVDDKVLGSPFLAFTAPRSLK